MRQSPFYRVARRIHSVLSKTETRLVLSALILLSILPLPFVERMWSLFLLIFGAEFLARLVVMRYIYQEEGERGNRWVDVSMLVLDLVALVSFLPLQAMHPARYLRLLRFTRLIILFGYWGGMFRTLLELSLRRERLRQLLFLAFCVAGMTFVSGAILGEMDPDVVRRDLGFGATEQVSFVDLLWWSFQQVEDPGNLVKDAEHVMIWVLSLSLTLGGLFLFSFFIGIGTTLVEELVTLSREQPVGLRDHSILLNAGEHSPFFVSQVVDHYLKQIQRPRWMVMGPALDAEHMASPRYRRIHYRRGTPYHPEDLAKVDAPHAKRIIVLASPGMADPDAETISAVLSSRQANARAQIYAELVDEKNAPAVLAAGALHDTIVVPTDHMLALVAANILVCPDAYPVIDELLTARGNEIYSFLYPLAAATAPATLNDPEAYGRLMWSAWKRHGCLMIGLGVRPPDGLAGDESGVDYLINPVHNEQSYPAPGRVLGMVAVTRNFEQLREVSLHADVYADHVSDYPPPEPVPLDLAPDIGVDGMCVLICGYRSRTTLLIEHVILFNSTAEITIMLRDEAGVATAREHLQEAGVSENQFADPDIYESRRRGTFSERADGSWVYRDADGRERGARIQLIRTDWTSRQDLLRSYDCGFDLARVTKLVIQAPTHSDGDPDALAVMTVMKLHNLLRSERFRHRLHPDLHVVVEMVDLLKTDLLAQRFVGAEERLPLTIVPVEKIRNVLMFYSTVVPGFCPIFREIFDRNDQVFHYCHLQASGAPDKEVDYGELVWSLHRRYQLLLMAVCLRTEDGGRRIVSLSEADESPLRLGDITGFYVVGDSRRANRVHDPEPPAAASSTDPMADE